MIYFKLISFKIYKIVWNKIIKNYLNLIFIRDNGISAEGAEKLCEGVSKLVNLTNLNLDFR